MLSLCPMRRCDANLGFGLFKAFRILTCWYLQHITLTLRVVPNVKPQRGRVGILVGFRPKVSYLVCYFFHEIYGSVMSGEELCNDQYLMSVS